jgi:hypothetical protein
MNTAVKRQAANESDLPQKNHDPGNVRAAADPADYLVELKYRDPANLATGKFATGLGIFSFALGLAELLAPQALGKVMGLNEQYRSYLPALGLREIASGIGIFASTKPTAAVWSRVGGDAMDLAFLGSAFAADDTNKARLAGATAMVLGATALDWICAQQLSAQDWTQNTGNPMAPTTIGQPSGRHSANVY